MDRSQSITPLEPCYFCGCDPRECDPKEHDAATEEHRRWVNAQGAPTGAFRSDLVTCSKCKWPLLLHGVECEALER